MWPPRWKKIAREAEESFQYMLEHDLIQSMDHFCIYSANLTVGPYYTEFHEAYAADVEKQMIPWIREEERSGRLKDREQWRPFRDAPYYERSLMGYHRLFVYEPTWLSTGNRSYRAPFGPGEVPGANGEIPRLLRVYFMLGIASYCWHAPDNYNNVICAACIRDRHSGEHPNFVATLYGWEEDDTPCLKPYAHFEHCEKEYVDVQMPVVPTVFWDSYGDDDASWGYTETDSDYDS